jgi:chitin disaccharide deacetylase
MNSPRVIVNADDFGLSRGISDAVLHAHTHGILTSASIMANQPASGYALALLRQMPRLGIGIHLNLCAGRPVLPLHQVPSLVGANGEFHSPCELRRKLWRFQISQAEIEAEFRAQIRWLKVRGVVPLHADSHLHVHLYPAALCAFVRALKAEGVSCARAPRCTLWPAQHALGGPHEGVLPRRLAIQAWRTALQFSALRHFAMPHSRIAFRSADRHDRSAIARCWTEAFTHLPHNVFELTCHPGQFESGFSEADRIAEQRQEELRILTSPAIRDAIERNSIQLIRYADLCEPALKHQRTAEAPAA